MSTETDLRYKGRFVTKKQLMKLKKIATIAKKSQKSKCSSENVTEENLHPNEEPNLESEEATNIADDQSIEIEVSVDVMDHKTKIEQVDNAETDEATDNASGSSVVDGRRIVEFSVLGRQMWCTVCKEALSLDYIESERRQGLGSILLVRCHKCFILNIVTTGQQHTSSDTQMNRFDINTNLMLGIMSAGIGLSHVNKILGCLNIPAISFSTYKRYKDEVDQLLEHHAKKT